MRVHGHQGFIVTSLDEATRSSRVHRNLIARLHGRQGREFVTSLLGNLAVWLRLQARQSLKENNEKQQKTETKVLTTKLGEQ